MNIKLNLFVGNIVNAVVFSRGHCAEIMTMIAVLDFTYKIYFMKCQFITTLQTLLKCEILYLYINL